MEVGSPVVERVVTPRKGGSMEITEVKVFPIQEEKLRAFVSIVIDRCFMVNDIKVIQGRDGLFISMPSRRKKNGDFKDIAHPLNNDTRRMIEERILTEYEGAVGERFTRRPHRVEGEVAVVTEGAEVLAAQVAVMVPSPAPQTLDEVQEQHLSDSFWTVR
jgi:stage V sporulation protein G